MIKLAKCYGLIIYIYYIIIYIYICIASLYERNFNSVLISLQVCGCSEARTVWHSQTSLLPIPAILLDWKA